MELETKIEVPDKISKPSNPDSFNKPLSIKGVVDEKNEDNKSPNGEHDS